MSPTSPSPKPLPPSVRPLRWPITPDAPMRPPKLNAASGRQKRRGRPMPSILRWPSLQSPCRSSRMAICPAASIRPSPAPSMNCGPPSTRLSRSSKSSCLRWGRLPRSCGTAQARSVRPTTTFPPEANARPSRLRKPRAPCPASCRPLRIRRPSQTRSASWSIRREPVPSAPEPSSPMPSPP